MVVRAVIADDSILMRDILGRQLRRMGYEVVGEAADVSQLLAIDRAMQPNLVVMDDSMPLRHGGAARIGGGTPGQSLDAMRTMLQEQAQLAVAVTISHQMHRYQQSFLDAGAAICIPKPFRSVSFDRLDRILRLGTVVADGSGSSQPGQPEALAYATAP